MKAIHKLSIYVQLTSLAALLMIATPVAAQDKEEKPAASSEWVGKTVMTKGEAAFRLPGKTVSSSDVCEVMKVDLQKGAWLWITTKGGWVNKKDVIEVSEATDYFTEEIKKKASAENFFLRGMAWFRQGRYYVATGDFKNAIKITPAPGFFNARGEAWRLAGQNERAIADFGESIKRGPKFASPYNNRGLANMALGKTKEAIKDFDAAIKLDDEFRFAYYNRGLAYRSLQQQDKAIADFSSAIKVDKLYADALNARGNCWIDKKEFKKARTDYEAALKANREYVPAYFNRGHLNKMDGKFADALKDYEKAIELNPKYAPAHNGVAWLTATCPDDKFRDGKKAVKYAERARELGGGEEDSYIGTLAAAEAELGNFDKADSLLKRAIELDTKAYRSVRAAMRDAFDAKQAYREKPGATTPGRTPSKK
jgi:tetratricopeptide (TPR) repeat protein